MTGHRRLTWMNLSPARALAVAVSSLVVVAAMLAAAMVLSGCAPETNGGFQRGSRGGAMRPPPGPSVYEIITRLELEPEQLPAVRTVLERAEDEREEIQEEIFSQRSGGPDPAVAGSLREKMGDARARTEADLSELLTYEQMAEYRKMMDEADRRRDGMQTQMDARRGGGRGGKSRVRGS